MNKHEETFELFRRVVEHLKEKFPNGSFTVHFGYHQMNGVQENDSMYIHIGESLIDMLGTHKEISEWLEDNEAPNRDEVLFRRFDA